MKEPAAVNCKGRLDEPQRQPGKCGVGKHHYIRVFSGKLKPCSWLESCRSSVETAGLFFKVSLV